jgi:hypothetical protein
MPSVVIDVRAARVVMILAALMVAPAGVAATPAQDAPAAAPAAVFLSAAVSGGKSFLDHVRTTYAEEPSYSVPATFPGPLAPSRKPETPAMLLACLGLLAYLGSRRQKALAGSS